MKKLRYSTYWTSVYGKGNHNTIRHAWLLVWDFLCCPEVQHFSILLGPYVVPDYMMQEKQSLHSWLESSIKSARVRMTRTDVGMWCWEGQAILHRWLVFLCSIISGLTGWPLVPHYQAWHRSIDSTHTMIVQMASSLCSSLLLKSTLGQLHLTPLNDIFSFFQWKKNSLIEIFGLAALCKISKAALMLLCGSTHFQCVVMVYFLQ